MARKSKISSNTLDEISIEMSNEQQVNTTEMIAPAMSDNDTQKDSYNRSRCGGALRQTREEQGLSIQDVASRLRLSPKQIEAIEGDNFTKLPEPTIVRGFIRNYAKLLKISAGPLLDAYTVLVPSSAPYELTIKPTSNMHVSSTDKPKTSSYLWAGLAALIALGVWLFYQSFIEKPSPTKASTSIDAIESLPEPALPAAERATEETPALQPSIELTLPPAADSATLPAEPTQTTPAPISNLSAGESATVAATVPAVPASNLAETPLTEAVITPKGIAKLEFNANQETWVSVTDADGKQIYDKIIFAGSREVVQGKPPLSVIVGNAGATNLSMNGKTVELAPHSRNNVARIKLE